MKIEGHHYRKIKDACDIVRAAYPSITLESYLADGLTEKRYVWDVYNAAKIDGDSSLKFTCEVLYRYLNDTHVYTAIRKAVLG